MKNLLIILLFSLPFTALSGDMLFNRLEKLNKKDQTRCLEVAKRYMQQFPKNPAPYYFSSIIYNAKADKSRSTSGKYRNLKQAISYAITFEEKDDGTIASRVNWSDYTSELKERAYVIADKLEEEDQEKYSSTLLTNIAKLDKEDKAIEIQLEEMTLVESKTESEVIKLQPIDEATEVNEATEETNVNSNAQFFGMPKGTELITSASKSGEREILQLINAERAKKGMSSLEWDEDLANAARYHAYDLATQDYFDHASYDRSGEKLVQVGGTFDRIKKFYSKSFVNAENIAAGNKSANDTYMQWYNSKGHYENMFNPSSKKVGLGVFYDPNSTYGYYWVMCSAL